MMNPILNEDPAVVARMVSCDVFSELSHIKKSDGFNTDLGVRKTICGGVPSWSDVQDNSALISWSMLGTEVAGGVLKRVAMPVIIRLALISDSAQETFDCVLQDITRALEVSLKIERDWRSPHSLIKHCTVEAIEPRKSEVFNGELFAVVGLRIGVSQKRVRK